MKKLILLFVILNMLQNPTLKAQWVTIPDTHFVTWLTTQFPTCMSGNLMDTTCAGITSATSVDVSFSMNIVDITGIQYFENLITLNCSNNQISFLPPLPTTLQNLNCSWDTIASLPTLPAGLITLNCSVNNIISALPALPNTLTTLNCGQNNLTALPTLPNSLTTLYCYYNHITSLPSLPNSLQYIYCSNNPLTGLPTLPTSLITLDCSYSSITSLPALPNTLSTLTCNNNLLTAIPAVPNSLASLRCQYNLLTSLPLLSSCTSLTTLYCQYNQLTVLPALPTSISQLNCSHNLLTALPSLPAHMSMFICNNNNITCFPFLPDNESGTFNFNISSNPFTCLPNYVPMMDSLTLLLPLCVFGNLVTNPNNCPNASGIIGYTYKDINGDCIYNAGDVIENNIPIKLYDGTGTLISQTYTFSTGLYNFAEPTGTYTVKVDTTGKPYTAQCPFPGIDSTAILTTLLPLANINFDYNCKPGFDLGVQSIYRYGEVFPGHEHKLRVTAGDMSNWYNLHCAAGVAGQVVITVAGPVTYDSITYGSLTPTIAGNVYTYTVADFGLINNSTAFGLNFSTDTTLIGVPVCVNVSVTPTVGDNNVINNTANYCYVVDSSHDPNIKETYPANVPAGFTDYFYYTIHFQNTGTAAAIDIHLRDTLDATNLDLNTFEVINYSHPNTIWLTGNKLSVYYTNINLPDSSTDFNGSQSFIQYRIKPKPGRIAGTHIYNKASIYFDYNAPVVTNTSVNTFINSVGISEINNQQSTIEIYPNPATSSFIVTSIDKIESIKIYNVLSEIVWQNTYHNITTANIDFTSNISSPSGRSGGAGIYFIEIKTEKGIQRKKVIKQ